MVSSPSTKTDLQSLRKYHLRNGSDSKKINQKNSKFSGKKSSKNKSIGTLNSTDKVSLIDILRRRTNSTSSSRRNLKEGLNSSLGSVYNRKKNPKISVYSSYYKSGKEQPVFIPTQDSFKIEYDDSDIDNDNEMYRKITPLQTESPQHPGNYPQEFTTHPNKSNYSEY